MRWRVIALVSLGVNLALLLAWQSHESRAARSRSGLNAESQAFATQPKTNLVVRRQFFSWHEIESPDYPAFIANLRDIGCPEQTIRDIIIADVNALYSRKRSSDLVTAEQQWWRSEPDTNVVLAASQKAREMEDERRALLARLLGPNWEAGDLVNMPRPSRPGIILDGPVLGMLPAETKQALQDVSTRSQERLQAYLDQPREEPGPDAAELAKLRQQTRAELAKILAPPQLEEFLLRYSQNANNLRNDFGQLRFFNASPEEFRAAFRSTDVFDQQIQLLADANDPNALAQRKSLEDQRENALKLALGAKRYDEYKLLQDPVYREAVATAQQAGTPEAARTIYELNLAVSAEQDRIRRDPNLTAEQKNIELKRIELEQLKANTLATGQDLPPEPATATTAPAPDPQRTYNIRSGDTEALIALRYGLPVTSIRMANPGVDFNRLKAGQALNIPSSPPPLPPPPFLAFPPP